VSNKFFVSVTALSIYIRENNGKYSKLNWVWQKQLWQNLNPNIFSEATSNWWTKN